MRRLTFAMLVVLLAGIDAASAQTPQPPPARPPATAAPSAPAATPADPVIPAGVKAPSDYVIGADDQLSIIFWRSAALTRALTASKDLAAVSASPAPLAAARRMRSTR